MVKGQTYRFFFWAQSADAVNFYDVDLENHKVTMKLNDNNSAAANNEKRDAFYVMEEYTINGPLTETITLRRPFAQVNVGIPVGELAEAKLAGIDMTKSSFTFSNVATELDAFTGVASAEKKVLFYDVAIPESNKEDLEGDLKKVADTDYEYIAMNYIFANADQSTVTDASFTVYTDKVAVNTYSVPNLPIQRNWRTNIIGSIMSDAEFNIVIDPIFFGDHNYPDTNEEALIFAALNGGEVTLTDDASLPYLDVRANFVLNINEGVTLTSGSASDYGIIVVNGTTTINGNGNIASKGGGIGVIDGAEVIFNGGNLDVNTTSTSGRYLFYLEGEGSTVTINGGNFDFNKTQNQKRAYIYAGKGTTAYVKGGTFGKASTRSGYTEGIMGDGNVIITGGTFGFDPTKWVAEGCKVVKLDDKWYVNDISTIVKTADELAAALKADLKNIKIILANDIDLPITSLGTITGGSGEYKLGGENTENIVIDLNGKKLNITTTYWSNLGAKNDAALFTIKNGTMTSSQATGTWNSYDVTFSNCDYVIENVVFEKAIAFDNTGKSAVLKNVTINETHDYYAMWICAAGQTVTIDGLTINSAGRGIKIDEQYVSTPAKVTLNINDATFKTTKKAAIMVKSVAGAEINLSEININDVKEDAWNAVWVDEDAAAYADLVIVNGGLKKVEGQATVLNTENSTITLVNGVNYGTLTAGELKNVTIEGAEGTVMIFKTTADTKIENVTLKNVKFEYTGATLDCGVVIDANAQIDNLVLEGCTFTGTGAKAGRGISGFNNNASIEIKNCTFKDLGYPIYAWGGYEALTIEGCTFENIKSWAIMPQSGFNGDLTVTGCNFNNCLGGGLIKAGTLTAGHTFTFTNNTITGCTVAGDHNWFQFNVSAGTSVISGNTKDGAAWTPGNADGLK